MSTLAAGKISMEEFFQGVTNARSKMQQNQATSISTLGISGLMEELKGMKDGKRKTELQDLLEEQEDIQEEVEEVKNKDTEEDV